MGFSFVAVSCACVHVHTRVYAHNTHTYAHTRVRALHSMENEIYILIYFFSFLCCINSEEMPFSYEEMAITSEEITLLRQK